MPPLRSPARDGAPPRYDTHEHFDLDEIVGESASLREVLRQAHTVAQTDATVLIHGETGTGKEMIANAIHAQSPRRLARLVKLNAAAIPATLLESELFGHERGAFTGALARRQGRFELAQDGTLFLDEIGELPLELQPKLLRLVQERAYERLGGTQTLVSNTRLVVATHRDLREMVRRRTFREDLYYRLNVFPITIPPLRERPEDIPTLTRAFVDQLSRKMDRRPPTVTPATLERLVTYDWPGNIRELQNVVERALILAQDSTTLEVQLPAADLVRQTARREVPARDSLDEVQRAHILSVLEATGWVIGGPRGAAVRLGMKRTTLNFRIRKLGIVNDTRKDRCEARDV